VVKIMKLDNLGQPLDNLKNRGCPVICSISTGFFRPRGQPSNLFTKKTSRVNLDNGEGRGNKITGKGWKVVHVATKTLITLGQTAGQPQETRLSTGRKVVQWN